MSSSVDQPVTALAEFDPYIQIPPMTCNCPYRTSRFKAGSLGTKALFEAKTKALDNSNQFDLISSIVKAIKRFFWQDHVNHALISGS